MYNCITLMHNVTREDFRKGTLAVYTTKPASVLKWADQRQQDLNDII